MHNAGFRSLDLPFSYSAFDIDDAAAAIQAMRTLGIRGYSVSVPHKETVVSLLDSLENNARTIGAVNTVINTGKKLVGYNTDWIGVSKALEEAAVAVSGKRVVVFGAGGAAKAGIFALQQLGAGEIVLSNRTAERGEKVAAEFGLKFVSADKVEALLKDGISLLINSTPSGSHLDQSKEKSPLLNFFQNNSVTDSSKPLPTYFEMVTVPTDTAKAAQESGARLVDGSRMLFFQALEQFRLFTETEPPSEAMNTALSDELRRV